MKRDPSPGHEGLVAQGRDFRLSENKGIIEHAFALRLRLRHPGQVRRRRPGPGLAHMMASGLCDKAEVNLDLGFGVDGGGIGA